MTASVDKFMRRLDRVERELLDAATKPRLRYSSIDGGTLEVKDLLGNTQALIGAQFDGSVTVASVGGTTPPSPSTPYVEPVVGGLMIYWDGTFVDNSPTRMDFRRVTFHAVTDVDLLDPLDPTQVVGEITIATGGQVTASLPPVEHFVFAVTWTDAGKFSVESDVAFGTPIEGSTSEQWQQHDDLLTELNTVTLPSIGGRLDAAEADVNTLQTVTLPALQGALDANEAEVATLRDTTIPTLDGRLDAAESSVNTLQTVTLPALDGRLDAAESDVNTLQTVTLPGLQGEIDAAEGRLTAAESDVNTLQTVTLPALDGRLDAAESDVNTLQTVTLPALDGRLDTAEGKVNTLETTTLPALDDRLAEAESDVSGVAATIGSWTTTGQTTIDGGQITADSVAALQLAANSVIAVKIATDAVTAGKIAADAISAREIQADAITASEIAANTITAAEIAASAITADELAANSVIATKIATDAVVAGKIAADAISAREIQADAITASEIAANTITAAEIAASAITADELAANSVIATKIATDAVVAGKIAADAITAREIQADSITASEIAANTITAAEIAAEAITADEVAADAITAIKIAADAVVADKIATDAVTAGKVAADAISAREIQADAITAVEIAANAVTAEAIAAEAVTAEAIAANSIGADHIIANSINTAALAATAIDGMTITGALIRTAEEGARVEITDTGMVQYDLAGALLTRIGGDRNKFSGSVDAEDIIVRDGLELFGRENYFGPNSQVTLRTGQGGSNIAPTISQGYKVQAIGSGYTQAFMVLQGYHTDGTNESGVGEFFNSVKLYAPGNRWYNLHQIKSTMADGSLENRWKPFHYVRIKNAVGERAVILAEFRAGGEEPGSYPQIGIFALDDSVMNTSGTVAPLEKHGLVLHGFSWFRSHALGRVIIDANHARMVAYASIDKGNNDTLELQLFEFIDGQPVTSPHNPADVPFAPWRLHTDEKVIGVTYGMAHRLKVYTPAEGGDTRVWVINTTHQNIVIQDDAGVFARRPEWEFPVMPGTTHRVYAHGDVAANTFSHFAHLSATDNYNQPKQTIQRYSNWSWSQTTTPKWFSFAWRGHSSKSPEWLTPPSPKASFAPIKRATATISVPPLPTPEAGQNQPRDPNKDVYGWVLYHGAGTSEPGNTTMYRATASPSGDPVTVQTLELEAFLPASGANPLVATQGFPSSSPSRIISSAVDVGGNPLMLLDGDGNMKGKSLAISDPSITVGGVEQGVWYDYNVGSTDGVSFRSGYTARYARIGNTVHVRFKGVVLGNINGTAIRVPVPFPFGFGQSAEDALGVGTVHNPGITFENCVATAATTGSGAHAVQLFRTTVSNSIVSVSNPSAMSGDEIFAFSVTYEAQPLA